ncbi:carbamoyl-phosphate synthase (glutamine-hydrolyzing) large subunit [Metallosphaera tengchongensis]|uniref:Carbamoyl phosphate synthase large chain n=1 Tax=Metallosphaera tengchongensis TaxID=1532350 RepID=A0A6N0NW90_9CREN|nr:carbamoyl-phosphate synthase (glutamine-hydrolyzing) large subunit [Metallosphaera tengchongensis]QKQ99627.1 carbamoyl-phosphate synthase (glutamine-hydrolyzing) large subunit [Metallosphaera tengchongensis]
MSPKGIKKVLIVGSGPIKIAEAAEFDYSGSQSLKAYREEGIETVLVNSNVATVQTSKRMTDKLYMIPVTWWAVEKVIEQERPDAIAIGFGGQTALNVGVDLYKKGILDKYGVKVLGTPIEGIEKALSREKFRETMIDVKIPVPPSFSAKSSQEALEKAEEIGYPVMVRVSFNLGGRGSTVAWDKESLKKSIDRALSQSYIGEVLVEKYLHHWKELEYEVVRDSKGNSAVIACVENLDPMGVHTGESIVITPCQTLDNREFQEMRTLSMRVAESISLVGECNVQFALDPNGYTNFVIETNPRMSRSSALASKATGYPLAYVSAKLSLGYTLEEILNKVSGATCACFEPSLDYVVIKVPRWDLPKFEEVDTSLGTEMKSVGEVMSIGRSFEEALQKAIRMLDIGEPGVVGGKYYRSSMSKDDAIKEMTRRRPYWPIWAAKAFKEGATTEEVYKATGVDKFFLRKLQNLVETYEKLNATSLDPSTLEHLKRLGFSDEQISEKIGVGEDEVIKIRHASGILPKIKLIDTLAGEWPAVTNYLYLTYVGSEDDIELNTTGNSLLIVGAGGFRIGVSVEFDWGVVELMKAATKYFNQVAVLNFNPETVSTDWDVTRKLYFDEISAERVLDVVKKENYSYVATFAGGQIGNNIAKTIEEMGVKLFGTSGKSVDHAEDREKFSSLLDRLGIRQPDWISAKNQEEIRKFLDRVGFPILVRPSYVLSGSSMNIVNSEQELREILTRVKVSTKYPVVISKFLENAFEAEIDGVSDGKGVVGITMEHVEEAGVHSGDSTMSIPTRHVTNVAKDLKEIAITLAREIGVKGPFNLQFVIKDNLPYVIEMNLRASRSMPFSSKAKGVNLMELAVKAIMEGLEKEEFVEPSSKSWAVKSAQFSWAQLKDSYPFLGPEMRSTGEAASLGVSFNDALLKSWLSSSPNRLPNPGRTALVYGRGNEDYLAETARNLQKLGLNVITLDVLPLPGFEMSTRDEAVEMMAKKEIELLVTNGYLKSIDYKVRRAAADFNVPLILNGRLGREVSGAMVSNELTFYEIERYGGGI